MNSGPLSTRMVRGAPRIDEIRHHLDHLLTLDAQRWPRCVASSAAFAPLDPLRQRRARVAPTAASATQRNYGAINRLVANLAYKHVMMTPRQIDLVQDSFAHVLPITGEAAAYFYDRLFALAPDTRRLFRGDMAEQGRKLFQTLALVVDALHEIDSVLPVASALAVRHVGYGVRGEHYDAVGAALIDTLRYGLGDGFDDETETGWTKAYGLLSHHMILAARTVDQCSVVP